MFDFEPIEIDAEEVLKKLEGTELNLSKIAKKMMGKADREVVKEAKQNAPAITGELRKSFSIKNTKELFSQIIKNKAFYASWQEEGNSHQKAKPFLKPAVQDIWETGKAETLMEPVLQKELQKYWNQHGES